MYNLILALSLLGVPFVGQAPASPAPSTPVSKVEKVELTPLEKAGLETILQQYQQVLRNLSQANIDVAKSHPGYHLDPKNPLSGNLLKDEPKPVEKPAAEKK